MKSKIQQKSMVMLFLLVLLVGMLPMQAAAADVAFDDTSMTELNISNGPIVINASGMSQNGASATALDPEGYKITGNGNSTNKGNLKVDGVAVTLEFDGLTINADSWFNGDTALNAYAVLLAGNANATIYLKDTNTITGGGRYAGITVADTAMLTLKCADHSEGRCRDGNAVGDPAGGSLAACANTLTVTGSKGIDGDQFDSGGIASNNVFAISAPGIGGVSGYLNDTTQTAHGFDASATAGGAINIAGGIITAATQQTEDNLPAGACIGSGVGATTGSNISISGGLVRAYSTTAAAGIGGAVGSPNGTINISGNAYVDAYGGLYGAAIGGGGIGLDYNISGMVTPPNNRSGGTINISGNAYVEAGGGSEDGAGIGTGGGTELSSAATQGDATISIDKTATVNAWSVANLPAIASIDGSNHSETPANVINHRLKETVGWNKKISIKLFPQADAVGDADYTTPEPIYGSGLVPYSNTLNFAYTVAQAGPYAEQINTVSKGAFTPMGHAEDVEEVFFTTTGLAHQDVKFHLPTLKIEDKPHVNYGEGATITATGLVINPANPIVSYQWQELVLSSGSYVWQDISGATDKTFTTPVMQDVLANNQDEPWYHCVATLQDTSTLTSNTGKIIALGIPLTMKPDDVVLNEGAALPTAFNITYSTFLTGDTAANTDYVTNEVADKAKISTIPIEIQKADGSVIASTADMKKGETYNLVMKFTQMNATDAPYNENYVLTAEVGKLYYGTQPPHVPGGGGETGGGGGGGGGGTSDRYTLNFDTNGGLAVKAEQHKGGTVVALAQTTLWENHRFVGWYADKALTQKITEIKMDGNKTVYAKWRSGKELLPTDTLDTVNHFAYVMGRKDGCIHPEANITRAETAVIFFRLLRDDVRKENLTTTSSFADVAQDAWCGTEIATLTHMGILHGRTARVFDPDAGITRAEFAAIASRFASEAYEGPTLFGDISGYWAENEINTAASYGWIQGGKDGNFRPKDDITRAETMVLVNRVLGRLPESKNDLQAGMITWPDNANTEAWFYLAVQEATNGHDYARKTDSIHETWRKLLPPRDWAALER